jgi:hypothetical protein
MPITANISIRYRFQKKMTEMDTSLPPEVPGSTQTRLWKDMSVTMHYIKHEKALAENWHIKYCPDGHQISDVEDLTIDISGRVKEQVLVLIEKDPENPFKDAVSELADDVSFRSSVIKDKRDQKITITVDTYAEAELKFVQLINHFITWANEKYKKYGVQCDIESCSCPEKYNVKWNRKIIFSNTYWQQQNVEARLKLNALRADVVSAATAAAPAITAGSGTAAAAPAASILYSTPMGTVSATGTAAAAGTIEMPLRVKK